MNPLSSQATFEQEHRALAALAVKAARNFSGTESSSDRLVYQLVWLEKWIQQNSSTASTTSNEPSVYFEQAEDQHSESIKNRVPDIDSILDLAMARFRKSLRCESKSGREGKSGSDEDSIEFAPEEHQLDSILSRLAVYHKKISAIILPPSASLGISTSLLDQPEKIEPARYQPRLQYLIEGLLQRGIYLDDLIITTGDLDPNQMRKLGYALVEIPKIGVEILVCNQKDEATFVSTRPLGIDFYTTNTKADLEKHTDIISRIVFNNKSDWLDQILTIVSTREIKEKVDVKNVVKLRELIRARITCEDFLAIRTEKIIDGNATNPRKQLKIEGFGLNAISTVFGVQGDPCGQNLAFYEIAVAVWGEGDSLVAEKLYTEHLRKNPQHLKQAMKAELNCEIFLDMPASKTIDGKVTQPRCKFKFKELGLNTIATILGVKGDPCGQNLAFYKLVAAIWGDEHPAVAEKLRSERLRKDPQLLIQAMKSKLNCEIFLEMSASRTVEDRVSQSRDNFKFKGLGLNTIGTILGIKGNPRSLNLAFYEIAAAIWGEEHPAVKEKLCNERLKNNPELLKQAMKAELSCEIFLGMLGSKTIEGSVTKSRSDFEFRGLGLLAIRTTLGIKGNPCGQNLAFYEIAAAIWGEEHPAVKEKLCNERLKNNPELLKQAMKAELSCEIFLGMLGSKTIEGSVTKSRSDFEFRGLGLLAIRTTLGIKGNPCGQNLAFYEIAAAIWGEDHPALAEKLRSERLRSDPQLLIQAMKAELNCGIFLGMAVSKTIDGGVTQPRYNFKFKELGLKAIGTTLGVKGNPCGKNLAFYELAAAIWGKEHPEVSQKLALERTKPKKQS
jgi:transcriptional regulator of met regulon